MNTFVSDFFDMPLFDPPLFEAKKATVQSVKDYPSSKTVKDFTAQTAAKDFTSQTAAKGFTPEKSAQASAEAKTQSAIANNVAVASGKITEIILQDQDEYDLQLLMPLLAQLSQDNRWFAWVAPPGKMPKQWLIAAGIDINKIIVLKPDADHSTLDLAAKALRTGTCHAVISWPGMLKSNQLAQLQTAAKLGNSHAILVRPR